MRPPTLVLGLLSILVLLSVTPACAPPAPTPTSGPQAGTDAGPTAGSVAPIASPTSQRMRLRDLQKPAPVPLSDSFPRYGVAEAFRGNGATNLGISWERDVFSWADIQPDGPVDFDPDNYFPAETVKRERDQGIEIVGLIQFTPEWAAENPEQGHRSVPKNLSAPASSPDNYWAQFVGGLAAHYKGWIDRWIIWNEPEFKPGDKGVGESYSWLGSEADYYLLLKRAYQAIKAANPNATVVFAETSYWVDVTNGRRPFFNRLLDIAAADPEAKANNFFFDAVAMNIYRCPDDLYRIHTEMKEAMKAKGIDKPIWIAETNAMPYDDPATPKPQDGQRVTLMQQADYTIQALAMAAAAGYQWIGWYRLNDGGIWQQQEVWGLVRDDGTRRPAFQAWKTAMDLFSGTPKVTFAPLTRKTQPFGTPWPQDPNSFYPNWQVYQVVFDHPDGRRVTVLWNADGQPVKVRVPKEGSNATLVDKAGTRDSLAASNGWYTVDLAPATAQGPTDPPGYHFIGGPPMMIVEQGVPGTTKIQPPALTTN